MAHGGGADKGQEVKGELAEFILQDDPAGGTGELPCQIDLLVGKQPGGIIQPLGAVMVAGRVISDRVNAASAAQTALKNIVFVGANATVRGYSVTYEKDGGTGDVPVDATMYADGEIVQLSKSYPLTKSSKSQIGWALSSGGNAVDTVTIAGADVKVYPVFEA